MSSTKKTITIPAEMVGRVRNSLFGELAGAAHDVGQACEWWGRESHPEWFAGCLASFDEARALLGELGWTEATPPAAVQIDVERYGDLVLAAVRGEVEIDDAAIDDVEKGRITDAVKIAEVRGRAGRMREYVASVEREFGRS